MTESTAVVSSPEVVLPVGVHEPMPHRKVIRSWTNPFAQRDNWHAFVLLAIDYVLFGALVAGAVLFSAWWLQLLCGLAAGFVIGRLFIIGHDACHMSLTPNRKLNQWLGRIAFLPSLTAYSLWDVGHNVIHHGYTCLKGVDFVWEPLTKEEYDALNPGQRFLQKLYRSGWFPGLYYMIEIWWKREFFPNKKHMPTRRPVFLWDNILVSAFAVLWLVAVTALAMAFQQPVWQAILFGAVVPFLFWVTMIGFVVYVHHTHEKVSWQKDKSSWSKAAPFVSTTVHLTFPFKIGAMMHHIMEHTAHHVDMTIPLYKLKDAQNRLEEMLPGRIVVQPFSWNWYFDTARKTKLYCFERHCWTDFYGNATSKPREDMTVVPQ